MRSVGGSPDAYQWFTSLLGGYKSLSGRMLGVGKRLANKSTHVDSVGEGTVSKPYHMWLDPFIPLGYDPTKRRD